MIKYVGKGDSIKYWRNTGNHFGYPSCCIEAFLEGNLPDETPYDGTGFRCCSSCLGKPYEEMVEDINSRRLHPLPFPDSSGFVRHYKEGLYEQ